MTRLLFALMCLLPSWVCAQRLNSDGTVTFSLPDSSYKEVYVEGSIAKSKCRMARIGNEWLYTSGVLPSEMYTYRFYANGKYILDSANANVVRDIDDMYNFFIVSGEPGSMYVQQDVPHGQVWKVWYPSSFSTKMTQRRMFVYLPPEYASESSKDKSYPVLYLLHGTGCDETSWCDMGRLPQIMDNMIAQGKCQPMIVVMPNGIAEQDAAPGESPYMKSEAKHVNVSSWMGRTEAAFPTEVMGYVEANYRVIKDKEHRAIAGISMGGMHTIAIAMNNPDSFDYVGLFSPQTISGLTEKNISRIKKVTKKLTNLADYLPGGQTLRNKVKAGAERVSDVDIYSNVEDKIRSEFSDPPKLYYIAIGRNDKLRYFLNDYLDLLDGNHFKYSYHESAGAHTWDNWRQYLLDFLPQLFK